MLEERLIDFAVIIIGMIEILAKQRMRTAAKTSAFKNQHSSNINQIAKGGASTRAFAVF